MEDGGESVGIGDQAVVRKIPADEVEEDDDMPDVSRRGWALLFSLLSLAVLGLWKAAELLLGLF